MQHSDESRAEMLSLSKTRTLNSHLSQVYDGKAYTLSLSGNEDVSIHKKIVASF